MYVGSDGSTAMEVVPETYSILASYTAPTSQNTRTISP